MSSNEPRERLPYRLNPVLEKLRDLARETDSSLEDVVSAIITSLEDDGAIDDREAIGILSKATRAYNSNGKTLNVLTLLDSSGSEVALREVERLDAQKREKRDAKR
jgi:hypothetical protein